MAPQDAVHPYLLFRGCDIKDLHVHETQTPAVATTSKDTAVPPPASDLPAPPPPPPPQPTAGNKQKEQPPVKKQQQAAAAPQPKPQQQPSQAGRGGNENRRPKKPNSAHQVGTGASLLNRKPRGTIEGGKETFCMILMRKLVTSIES